MNNNKCILSIQIPTVVGREMLFDKLYKEVQKQAKPFKNDVEVIFLKDNKEFSIGAKRQKLYEMSKGYYSWQIDDDDWIHPEAIYMIMQALKETPDCITFKEKCFINGREESSLFTLAYKEWCENTGGFEHIRTPFHKTPILTKLCLKAGVKDMRYGEDHQFAKDIYPLLKKEAYIDEYLYIYRYKYEDSQKKYGIKENEIKNQK